jgi:hypothetical protein
MDRRKRNLFLFRERINYTQPQEKELVPYTIGLCTSDSGAKNHFPTMMERTVIQKNSFGKNSFPKCSPELVPCRILPLLGGPIMDLLQILWPPETCAWMDKPTRKTIKDKPSDGTGSKF